MKRAIQLIVACILIGCAHTGPGKFLATTAQTVDAGMKAFFIEAELGKVTLPQSNAVVNSYLKYQSAMMIATNTYAAANGTNAQAWVVASNALWQSRIILLQLLNGK